MYPLRWYQFFPISVYHDRNSVSDDLTCVTSTSKHLLVSSLILKFRNIYPVLMSSMFISSWTALILVYIIGRLKWGYHGMKLRLFDVPLYTILIMVPPYLGTDKNALSCVLPQYLCILSTLPWVDSFPLYFECLILWFFPWYIEVGRDTREPVILTVHYWCLKILWSAPWVASRTHIPVPLLSIWYPLYSFPSWFGVFQINKWS